MGGYGAWYLALSAPELYSKAASMSGAMNLVPLYQAAQKGEIESPFAWHEIFEHPEALASSDNDLLKLYSRCRDNGLAPKLYQACGTEDFLYANNKSVKNRMELLGTGVTYKEGPGTHTRDFWDTYIQDVLDWMLQDHQ